MGFNEDQRNLRFFVDSHRSRPISGLPEAVSAMTLSKSMRKVKKSVKKVD